MITGLGISPVSAPITLPFYLLNLFSFPRHIPEAPGVPSPAPKLYLEGLAVLLASCYLALASAAGLSGLM